MYSEVFSAIHHAALRVTDLDEASRRWSHVLGLTGGIEDGRALLRCAHEDYALVLEQSSQKPGLESFAIPCLNRRDTLNTLIVYVHDNASEACHECQSRSCLSWGVSLGTLS